MNGTCTPPSGESIGEYKFQKENFHGNLNK